MKKVLFLFYCMFCFSICCGCSSKETANIEKDVVNLETDDNLCTSDLKEFAKSEKGYYYWKGDLLYFCDAVSGKDTVLCSNSNCKHNSSKCDAFYSEKGGQIFYYQNNLYLIEDVAKENKTVDVNLIKVSEDGSKRTNLLTLFQVNSDNEEGYDYEVVLHRGYCYYYQNSFEMEKEVEAPLYRVALKQDAKPEKIISTKGYGVSYSMLAYKQKLYVNTTQFTDSKYTKTFDNLKIYDIETSEIQESELTDIRRLYMVEDVLYYTKENMIWKMEEGKKAEKFYDLGGDVFGKLWFDGNYFYFDNSPDCLLKDKDGSERKVLVLDKKGKKVDEFPVELQYEFLGGDSKRLFWMDFYTREKVCVFDTAQIGTDTHKLEELK